MTRRGLFQLVLGALAAPFIPKPKLGHYGSNAFAFFTGDGVELGRIPQRKIIARVRITQETLDDVRAGAFGDFMAGEFAQAARDAARREEAALLR